MLKIIKINKMAYSEEEFELKNIRMTKQIGQGSFGFIYAGKLKNKNLNVAVKRVSRQKMKMYGDYLIQAFEQELENMKKCECENSVKIYRDFQTEHNYNIVMELCDGNLSNELSSHIGPYNAEEVKDIMCQLNNAFRKLYENKIIHRDLKLQNILIKYTDETKTKFIPKLCDYGFSKNLDSITGTHLGTPATMAPEIMKNSTDVAKSDLWSIGVIIYQLHFKLLPYPGFKEEQILGKIQRKYPIEQSKDPLLNDLIKKLLVEDPKDRISWEDYFNHPFFRKEEEEQKSSSKIKQFPNNIIQNKRYSYIDEFDIGFKNENYQCFLAQDLKRNKKVIIKCFDKKFFTINQECFKKEHELNMAFHGNKSIFLLINILSDEKNTRCFVYDYVEGEILSNYLSHHDFTENEIQKMNKKLFDKIFCYNETNHKIFEFISKYSIFITKSGEPMLFDFGFNKLFLPEDEVKEYYLPNPKEYEHSLYPMKTNVMNYGITLLKCFFGKNLNIKIDDKTIILPNNKVMSNKFSRFISNCLQRNINTRKSWLELSEEYFISELFDETNINNKNYKKRILIDKMKLKSIFESFTNKFDLINSYYNELDIDTQKQFINEIEGFLILIYLEQASILRFLEDFKNQEFISQEELCFISIKNDGTSDFLMLNLANSILRDIQIFDKNNTEMINNFTNIILKQNQDLKKIIYKIHDYTKSLLFMNDYEDFMEKLKDLLTSNNYPNYMLHVCQLGNKYIEEKNNERASKEIPIVEYICEYILILKKLIYEGDKTKIFFDQNDYIAEFDKIFQQEDEETNKINISIVSNNKPKGKYLLISFLGYFFKSLNSLLDKNKDKEGAKLEFEGCITLYFNCMLLLINTKEIPK